jgi:hypothetical protein
MSEADSTSRRRPPTIDLTAKEVETASPERKPRPDAEAASTDAKPEPVDEAATGAGETPSSGHAGGSSGRMAPYGIGLAAGAIGVAAIAAGLWFADLIPVHDASVPSAAQSAAAPHADAPAMQSAQSTGMDQISARLDRIDQALQGPPHTDAALAGRVAGAEAQAKALSDSVAGLTRRVDDLAVAAQTALAEAKSAVAAADAAKDAAKNAAPSAAQSAVQRSDIEAVESRVAALQSAMKSLDADLAKRASSSNADDRVMRLAIAAAALRAAVERGAPFAAELAAVKALGADPTAIAPLEPFAAQGLVSTAELGRELTALTPALSRTTEPQPSNTSLLATLESRAQKLVRITPVGTAAPPAGDDAVAVIGRLNVDAARGDIDAALAEIAKLPDEARALAKAWADKAAARQAALAQSRRIAAEALTALAKPESR